MLVTHLFYKNYYWFKISYLFHRFLWHYGLFGSRLDAKVQPILDWNWRSKANSLTCPVPDHPQNKQIQRNFPPIDANWYSWILCEYQINYFREMTTPLYLGTFSIWSSTLFHWHPGLVSGLLWHTSLKIVSCVTQAALSWASMPPNNHITSSCNGVGNERSIGNRLDCWISGPTKIC